MLDPAGGAGPEWGHEVARQREQRADVQGVPYRSAQRRRVEVLLVVGARRPVVGAVGQRRVALAAGRPGKDVEVGLPDGEEVGALELVGVVDEEPAPGGGAGQGGRRRRLGLRGGLGDGHLQHEYGEDEEIGDQHRPEPSAQGGRRQPPLAEHDGRGGHGQRPRPR